MKLKDRHSFYAILFLIIVLLLSAFPLFSTMAQIWEKQAAEDWARTFDPIEDLSKRYPYRNDNEAAIQLKLLANRLGIEFTVPGESQHYSPSYADAKRFKMLAGYDGILASYLRKQLERPDETVDCPSDFLATYLMDYHKELELVRNHLLTSPPIFWKQNLNDIDKERIPDAALPRLLGILELQKLLTARGLDLAASERDQEAESYLEAGWKLNESLRTRSDLLSQLVALASDQQLLGLMRKLPVATDWLKKIDNHNYRKAFVTGYMVEAWLLWRMREEAAFSDSSILNNALDPYIRFSVALLMENERQEIERIRALNPCTLGYEDIYKFEALRFPEWSHIQRRFLMFDKNYTYGRIKKIEIDRELTAKIIQVRHGYFPQESSEWSTTCKDGIWAYRHLPDGSTSIEYATPLEVPHMARPLLPTSFTVTRFEIRIE